MPSRSRSRPRRKQSAANLLYALFVVAPLWVCPLVAAGAGLAVLNVTQQALHWKAATATGFAEAVIALILLTGVFAWREKSRRRRNVRRTRTLGDLRALSWKEFEALVADAYRRYGWSVRETGALSGGGADGGVDLVMRRSGEVVAVQCKRWRMRDVGVDKARELQGALADCGAQRGILVTCGRFTPAAEDFARRNRVKLVGGAELLALLPGSTFSAPDARTAQPVAMSCPHCHAEMVMRRGPHGRFWGCRQYPHCRGTRPLAA